MRKKKKSAHLLGIRAKSQVEKRGVATALKWSDVAGIFYIGHLIDQFFYFRNTLKQLVQGFVNFFTISCEEIG